MQQENMQNSNAKISLSGIKKVLIIKGPGIGDSVTTIPLARNFKKFLGCEVHVLEEHPPEKQGKFILKNCPHIDKVVRFDYNIWNISPGSKTKFREIATLRFIPDFARFAASIMSLRKEKYDMVFEGFPGTRNTAVLTKLIGARIKVCCSSHAKKEAYDIVLPIYGKNITEAENCFFDVFSENITKKDNSLEIFGDDKKNKIIRRKNNHFDTESPQKTTIGITTGHTYKRWQNEKWADLIKRMPNSRILILGNSEQAEDAKEIASKCSSAENLAGMLTLEETIEKMKGLDLFICTNGGLMWVAAAMGIPTIAVSGASPYWWDPRTKNVIVVRRAPGEFYEQKEYTSLQDAKTSDVEVKDVIEAVRELSGRLEA